MAYTKTVWKDEIVQHPKRFTATENDDGTMTLEPAFGTTLQEGTPVNAANLNNIEEGIASTKQDLSKAIHFESGSSDGDDYIVEFVTSDEFDDEHDARVEAENALSQRINAKANNSALASYQPLLTQQDKQNIADLHTDVDISGKQDKLIAGSGITIASDGKTISTNENPWRKLDITMTLENMSGVQMNLEGCTEISIRSRILASTNISLVINGIVMLSNVAGGDTARHCIARFSDGLFGVEPLFAKYANDNNDSYTTINALNNLTAFYHKDIQHVADINEMHLNNRSAITSCIVEFWVR